ncbi:metalloprotease-like isoform X2 [Nasonia vitripennis]|uniref:Peptidase M12B domain-containing protein n=1 Tax=Nasonia vitripennis TaxID=7425 RepID=A0A7M7QSN1_NASVI|nr:metalloprotease-like precursor [Nasonia vitripennis]XP_032452211.1 metalloprotease-like isoform X2 [Nasonia vitripennis]
MACKLFLLALCLCGVAVQSFVLRSDNSAADAQVDTRYVQVDVDGEQYNLNLQSRQRDVIYSTTPVWTVKSGQEGFSFADVTDKSYINGVFYDDAEFMATLLATYSEDETQIRYNGVVGVGTKAHTVVSYPEKWWKPVPVPDNDDVEDNSESVKEKSEETKEEILKLRSAYVPGEKTGKLEEALSILHPKVLVVVDYTLFEKLGKDIQKTVKYVATFWSAIDLRYSKLYSPYVKTIGTGIVIVTEAQTGLLEKARDYFTEEFIKDTEHTNYDSAFVMTASNTKTVQGQSHLGSICNRQYSTAFVEDDASFGGLLTATHELGHLLNLPHDGSDEAESCKVESGDSTTVMAPSTVDANIVDWSQCSRVILNEFSKTEAAQCLKSTYRYE